MVASARDAFRRLWAASAISSFGTALTAVALPVLVVQVLEASPVQVGIVAAAQFVPYAVLGLIAGVYVDRWRRKRVLVWASAGRAVALCLIPLLWIIDALDISVLVVLLLMFGSLQVFAFAASQSLLPRVVTRDRLLVANTRIDQTDAAAQTAGPALGGGLVGLLGAPLAILVDAVSYLVEAVLISTLRVDEPPPGERGRRNFVHEAREGLAWTCRHRTLAPLSVSTHVWFVANAAAFTVLALFALRELDVTPFVYGLLFAAAGIAMLAGASAAPWSGRLLGAGRTIIAARIAYPLAWAPVAVIAATGVGDSIAIVGLFVAMTLQGIVAGIENPHEMGYRQAVTPDGILGRVSATIRSANRSMAALGALLGGITVAAVGVAPAFVGVVVVFAIAALIAGFSPLRSANHDDSAEPSEGWNGT
ncbi:MFS transporter [Microbacterium lacus]|uniref:MFS transporter n=1 Tax=Microbacterium lacus TaxID=415217 RepID=UPI00384E65D7